MKEQYECGFLFVCGLYLVFAVLAGGIATFILQFLAFQLNIDFGRFAFVFVVDITLFVFVALLLLWDGDFKGYGNRILAILAFLIACSGMIIVGNNLYYDFVGLFRTVQNLRDGATYKGSLLLWIQMTELSALIGLAVLSGRVLLARSKEMNVEAR